MDNARRGELKDLRVVLFYNTRGPEVNLTREDGNASLRLPREFQQMHHQPAPFLPVLITTPLVSKVILIQVATSGQWGHQPLEPGQI